MSSTVLAYEGIRVHVPTVEGIEFQFKDGNLSIECSNYTGSFVLSSTLDVLPSPARSPTSKKRPLATSTTDDNDINDTQLSPSITATLTCPPSSQKSEKNASQYDLEMNILTEVPCTPAAEDEEDTQQQPWVPLSMAELLSPEQKTVNRRLDSQPTVKNIKDIPDENTKPITVSTNQKPKKSPKAISIVKKKRSSGKKKKKMTPVRMSQRPKRRASSASKNSLSAEEERLIQLTSTTPPQIASFSVFANKSSSCPSPVARWGHTATMLPLSSSSTNSGRLLLYGGVDDQSDATSSLGDLWVFDIATQSWSCPMNCTSVPRSWHSSLYLSSKNVLLVFGGERSTAKGNVALDDIMVLDTDVYLWYPPGVSGAVPSPRSGHTCALIDTDVIVFGGNNGRKWYNGIHVLNTESWNWKTVSPSDVIGEPPAERTFHSATVMGDNKMVVFGGNDASRSYRSVHVLQRSERNTWTWFHPVVVGSGPCARTGHSATAINTSTLLIYGGWDPNSDDVKPFNDAFLLNIDSWEWKPVILQENGEKLSSPKSYRVGHQTSLLSDSSNTSNTVQLIVSGGQDFENERHCELDLITLEI